VRHAKERIAKDLVAASATPLRRDRGSLARARDRAPRRRPTTGGVLRARWGALAGLVSAVALAIGVGEFATPCSEPVRSQRPLVRSWAGAMRARQSVRSATSST